MKSRVLAEGSHVQDSCNLIMHSLRYEILCVGVTMNSSITPQNNWFTLYGNRLRGMNSLNSTSKSVKGVHLVLEVL